MVFATGGALVFATGGGVRLWFLQLEGGGGSSLVFATGRGGGGVRLWFLQLEGGFVFGFPYGVRKCYHHKIL